ncbi:MAG: biotin transporter BioY [Alkaliphilus sp.]|nr:biotin transporter BioY [Alkaliphilus sp.]
MKTKELILVALFAALTAIGAFIKIPIPPVPITLQFLFCAFAGVLLGSKLGLYSQLLYVGIGLMGVPVFTNGGGISYIFQPTFGYLLGFSLCAFIIGKLTENLEEINFKNIFFPVLAGLMSVYALGVPYLYLILNNYLGKEVPFATVLRSGFLLFIVQDISWSILIAFIAVKIIPSLRKAGYIQSKQT